MWTQLLSSLCHKQSCSGALITLVQRKCQKSQTITISVTISREVAMPGMKLIFSNRSPGESRDSDRGSVSDKLSGDHQTILRQAELDEIE